MSKVLIYSQEDLDLILELEKQKNEELQQENKKLNGAIQTYDILLKANTEENKRLKDNWNKLKEWASNFYNSEEVGWAGCGMRYTLEKLQELEESDSNE